VLGGASNGRSWLAGLAEEAKEEEYPAEKKTVDSIDNGIDRSRKEEGQEGRSYARGQSRSG